MKGSQKFLKLISQLLTLRNLYKSKLSRQDDAIVNCFLLLLRKKSDVISEFHQLDKNLISEIENAVEATKDDFFISFYYDQVGPIIEKIKSSYLYSLMEIYVFAGLEYDDKGFEVFDDKDFEDFFDFYIQVYFTEQGKHGSDSVQPKKLTSLINHFMPNSKDFSYYNPFGGLASLAIDLPKGINYYGEELIRFNWVIAKIRLMLNDCPSIFKFELADSVQNWCSQNDKKYDFIAFNPPFNLKLDRSLRDLFHSGYEKSPTANSLIIYECFQKLKENGKMAFVMPSGFLFSSNKGDIHLKKTLTENGHIDKVIALPEKILSFTSIAVNLIVINKAPNEDQQIEFIDASEKFNLKDGKTRVLDVEEIFALLSLSEKSNLKKTVSYQEIVKNRYNLSVNRYVFEDLKLSAKEKEYLTPLKNLVVTDLEKTVRPKNKVRVVRIRDLAENSLNSFKSFDELDEKISKYGVRHIGDRTLLLATMWKSLKPTIYKKGNEDVYYEPGSIYACRVDVSKIDTEYLLLELQKEYIQQQLEQLSVGSSIRRINRQDLLEIQVAVPIKAIQEKRKIDFKQSIILEQQQKLESLKDQSSIDIADENSFLRHKISGTLNNVIGTFNKLRDIIDNQISNQLPDVYSYKAKPIYKANLRDYLDRLNRDISSIHRAVKTTGVELSLREMKSKTFNFIELVEGYLEEVKNRPNCNFEIWFENDEEALEDNKVKEVFVKGDPGYLYQAFDNIIENAQRHGFILDEHNGSLSGNILEVSLFYNFEYSEVELNFCNTGNPLPENFSLETFTRKGSKAGVNSGKGIGGSLINEVVKAHKGKLGYKDESEQGTELLGSMFPTRFELTFPMEFKI